MHKLDFSNLIKHMAIISLSTEEHIKFKYFKEIESLFSICNSFKLKCS